MSEDTNKEKDNNTNNNDINENKNENNNDNNNNDNKENNNGDNSSNNTPKNESNDFNTNNNTMGVNNLNNNNLNDILNALNHFSVNNTNNNNNNFPNNNGQTNNDVNVNELYNIIKSISETQKNLQMQELKNRTIEFLKNEKMDVNFADFVLASDYQTTQNNIKKLKEILDKEVQKQVEKRIAGASPKISIHDSLNNEKDLVKSIEERLGIR